jgi:hypothetical protein
MNNTRTPPWVWLRRGDERYTVNMPFQMHTDSSMFCASLAQHHYAKTCGCSGGHWGWQVTIADSEGDLIHTIEDFPTLRAAKMAGYQALHAACGGMLQLRTA